MSNKGRGGGNNGGFMQPGSGEFIEPEREAHDSSAMVSLTRDDLIAIIREARRDPDKEHAVEAEAKRLSERRNQMVQIAKADERAKQQRQARCQHKKPNNEESSGGQEFSDGRVRIFCLRCQKTLRSYWSPQVAQGIALQRKLDTLGVTEDDLREAMEVDGDGVVNSLDLNPPDTGVHVSRSTQPSVMTED